MSFNTALSAPNLVSLRGDGSTPPRYHAAQYLSLCPNTTVFAARVNQATFTASFAQITFDTVTTGAFTDLLHGMTVYLSASNDIRAAYFVGRVRADSSGVVATSTVLNINETSADVSDNDFIFVINDFRVWDKLARESSGVQLKDFALTFRQLPPVIYGLKSAYAGIVSGSPEGLTIAFAASAIAGTSGATISSYAYTIVTGMTVTAGSAATANVTIRFDAGFYWLKLVVTDSGSRTATRYIPVWSVPTDLSAQVALGFTGSQISGDLSTGFNATIEAFDGISSVYDNTLAVIWDVESYNGVATNIIGNVRFVGRLRNETDSGQSDETYSYLTTTAFEIEGAGSQLSRITAPLLALRYDTSPTLWDEITNLTLWRAIVHLLAEHSTFLTLHSLEFDSTANTFLAKILNTQGGNLLAAVNDLAQSINGQMQFAYDGRCEVVRDLRYESTANRNAAVTVAGWTTEDLQDLRLGIDHIETVGKSEAAGGTFTPTSGVVTPLLAIAPGVAQGMGEGRNPLQRQILTASVSKSTAQSELNTRVGHHFALSNPTDQLTITHPDGYHFLIPAVNLWYTWTLAASTNLRGRAYTTAQRWLLTQTSISHDNETGTKTVEATYSLETEGVPGQTVTYPPPATIPTPISTIPPFDAYSNFPELPDISIADPTYPPPFTGNVSQPPQVAPANGNTVIIWTETQVWICTNFISTQTPTWNEITPEIGGSDVIVAVVFSGFIDGLAYCLVNTTTTSIVYYTEDVFASEPIWTNGTALGGLYKLLRVTNENNELFVYNPDTDAATSNTVSDELTSALGPQSHALSVTFPMGVFADGDGVSPSDNSIQGGAYSASGGRSGGGCMLGELINRSGAADLNQTALVIDLGAEYTVTAASWWFASTAVDGATTTVTDFRTYDDAKAETTTRSTGSFTPSTSYQQRTFTGSRAGVRYVVFHTYFNPSNPTANKIKIDDVSVTYTVTADKAVVALSQDNGANWATVQEVGDSPGSHGGFDTVKLGAQSLAGKDDRAAIATTLGGAYANYGDVIAASGQPTCIVVPRYDFGSLTSNNSNTATPEYLVGSNTSSGNHYLSKTTASGTTETDITPQVGADFGEAVSGNCLAMAFRSGNRIAAILLFDATRHLVVSTNAGGAWTDRGAVEDDADFITYRKGDGLFTQLFFADGVEGPAYSGNHGAVIAHKSYPSEDPLVGIAVYG